MTEEKEILDPHCETERWWELAKEYPIEAMSSALYWMLILEKPERWEQLQQGNIDDWVSQAAERLPFRERELFAADCAERVLCLYERKFPGDRRVRDAIEARRYYANGRISQEEWEAARKSVNDVASSARAATNDVESRASLSSAIGATETAAADAAAAATWYAAVFAEAYNAESAIAACYAERLWQWERAQAYVRGEVQ